MAHVIDYIEISVDDLPAAKEFYSKALGWAFTDYGPEYAGIQDPRKAGSEVGGITQQAANLGNGVIALMSTDDADAALAAVTAAGGTVTEAMHDYPGGRRFMFSDPTGNVFGIYETGALANT